MAASGPFAHYPMTHEAFGTILVSLSSSVFPLSEPRHNHVRAVLDLILASERA